MPANPVSITAHRIALGSPEYERLLAWPFPTEPFFVAQVRRVLAVSLPERLKASPTGSLWLYRDPVEEEVGFGSLLPCSEYPQLSGNRPHLYIPVLGVHPAHEGKGFGRRIVEHLIETATTELQATPELSSSLFLDVYVANARAIGLYEKFGFVAISDPGDFTDPDENDEPYLVMAKLLTPAP